MSSTKVTVTRCDLCGYGGAWSAPEDFRPIAAGTTAIDLCRWCADDTPRAWVESGGHRVSFGSDSWQCSCGAVYGSVVLRLRMNATPPYVLDAVPSLANATAHIHIERMAS